MTGITQQEELIEVLKFTPRTYKIYMHGYGGEIVMGTVDRSTYEYFTENDISLEDYATNYIEDEEITVPEEHQFISAGEWYDCDNIAHNSGVEMNSACTVVVEDEKGNIIWQHNLDVGELDEFGIECECFNEYYPADKGSGVSVFIGQSVEKGTFFGGDIHLTQPFDPKKLKFGYNDVNGWELLETVTYNDEDIDNEDYSTTGKGYEFDLVLNP